MPGETLDTAEVGLEFTATDKGMMSTLDQAQARTALFSQAVMQQAQQMRTAGLMMAGAGAAGVLMANKLMKGQATMEEGYARVNTMQASGEDATDAYADSIRAMTSTIPIAGGELAALAAQYQVLSAGISEGPDSLEVLDVAMKASVGGMTTTETAVDALTTAINAYGMSASEAAGVSDIMFTAIQRGKLDYESLSGALGPILGISAQLGVEFHEVAASLATMTKAGLSADIAGTSLRATMTAFIQPSEAMAASMRQLGYESGSAMLASEGFQGALEALAEEVGGSDAAIAEMFPNVRALTAVLPLTGKMAGVAAEDLAAMGDSAGAAGVAFEKMAHTTAAEMQLLETRMQQAMDSLASGATPVMMKLKGLAVSAAEGMARLNEETGGAVGAMMAIGSVILTVVGTIMSAVAQYTLMAMAHMQVAAMMQTEGAMIAQNTGLTVTNTGAKVANAGATELQAASEIHVQGAIQLSSVAHAGNASAQNVESAAGVRLATAKQILRAETDHVATATLRESMAHNVNTSAMGRGQTGALKMSGAFMKMSGSAGPIGLATIGIMGVAMAIGMAWKAHKEHQKAIREADEAMREQLDILVLMDDSFEDYAEAVEAAAEGNIRLATSIKQTALELQMANAEFAKGSDSAIKLRDSWVGTEEQLYKSEKAIEEGTKWVVGLSAANVSAYESMEGIEEAADKLFGTLMSEAEAIAWLKEKYDMTYDSAKALTDATGDLTAHQLDAAIAAKEQADAIKILSDEMAAQKAITDWHLESLDMTRASMEELNTEYLEAIGARETLVAIGAMVAETDEQQYRAILAEITAIDDQIAHYEEAIDLKEKMIEASADHTDAIWDEMVAYQSYLDVLSSQKAADAIEESADRMTQAFLDIVEGMEGWEGISEEMLGEYSEDYIGPMMDALEAWQDAYPMREIGSDMIDEWLAGIEARGGYVDETMQQLLESFIMDYMGFSTPKKGPLQGIRPSGGHLVQEYMGGMKDEVGRQGGAAGDVGVAAVGGKGGAVAPIAGRTFNFYGDIYLESSGDPAEDGRIFLAALEEEAGR